MADCDEWFVCEDGCLSVGHQADSVTYHSTLNTILVTTKEPAVKVIDVTSGSVLQSSDLSALKGDGIQCRYLPTRDKVVFTDGAAVGARKDLNGMLLLDTALQTPVNRTEDVVCVELALPEASHLFKCLMTAELPGVDYVEDVLRELEKEIDRIQSATKGNHKVAKWASVCLKLPHSALRSVCSNLVTELKRLHQNNPGLPVASAVNDRLAYLLPSAQPDIGGITGPVDRSLMYSESARRETFSKWPHMNYKWALPDSMAQAGFYHQPSARGDDRAMCFTCNVCLVCWEPTDEPWSEHERHSPTCPFVKGEYTQNVPMAVTYATEPAQAHGKSDKIECISTSSSKDIIATSSLHGNIAIWNLVRQLKKQVHFNVDPWDPTIMSKTGSQLPHIEDLHLRKPPEPPKEAWPEPPSDTPTDESPMEEELSLEPPLSKKDLDNLSQKNQSKSEIVEVGGAWKTSKSKITVIEIPLDDVEPVPRELFQRCRPSQDVLVSSLCTLGPPTVNNLDSAIVGAVGPPPSESTTPHRPSLVSGVAIRRNTLTMNDIQITAGLVSSGSQQVEPGSEVQALNRVNQAISGVPQIISSENSVTDSLESGLEKNPFVPYLLVHEIAGPRSSHRDWKGRVDKVGGLGGGLAGGSSSGTKVSSLVPTMQEFYMPQIMEMEEEPDPDVQIVGVTLPGHDTSNILPPTSYPGKTESMVGSQKDSESSKTAVDTVSSSTHQQSKLRYPKDGRVLQCIKLPPQVGSEQYVSIITPTLDGHYVVVVTAPKWQHRKISCISGCKRKVGNSNGDPDSTPATSPVEQVSSKAGGPETTTSSGCLLLYRVCMDEETVLLEEQPVVTCVIDRPEDALTSVTMLPKDVIHAQEEEDLGSLGLSTSGDPLAVIPLRDLEGQMVATTYAGEARILRLADCKLLASIQPPEQDKFVSSTYCNGVDRLCCCTEQGQLHFFVVSPKSQHSLEEDMAVDVPHLRGGATSSASREDTMESNLSSSPGRSSEELLVKQPLSTEVLILLSELTQFENLMPRFSATVPPCWTEIQQEQQQRRHPQHLQQQGEAMQHTRTWRLQQDTSSWDEHLFELVLPRSCCVGHIDLKFSLHPLCTSAPNIQVTLLKQNISSIGRTPTGSTTNVTAEVDSKIDFKGHLPQAAAAMDCPEAPPTGQNSSKLPVINNVLDPTFLQQHAAEILCGPVEMEGNVDLSGHSGIITLSSPQLLKVKSRSFLVHIKALSSGKDDDKKEKGKSVGSVIMMPSPLPEKPKDKVIKNLFDQLTFPQSATERLATSASKQKLDNVRGCDWIQEISITVRKSKKTSIPKDRLQRVAMVETSSFHEALLVAACGHEEKIGGSTSLEHRQSVALDILSWITAMQLNDPNHRINAQCIVFIVQSNLKGLVKTCFIESGRTVAHKCAKLVSLCTEYAKNVGDADVAPAFNFTLLQGLLDCLPLVPAAYSAGALQWYFTLLNRVKCMDVGLTGQKCADILAQVAKHYHDRTDPRHSLLKARFGLYGTPLDPILFDLEPPQVLKSGNSTPATYASVVGYVTIPGGTANVSAALPTAGIGNIPNQGHDEVDFRDLMSLSGGDKSSNKSPANHTQRHLCGLLEVEPLHFTCHATSDGTRMERMDAIGTSSLITAGTSGLSGTINFGEAIPSASAAGAALASLSTAMASAEQQLHMLQQKQQQLLKLQHQKQKLEQKLLVETTKSMAPTASTSTYLFNNVELLPPTPKTTPLFMTPPVTPPNESFLQAFAHNMEVDKPGFNVWKPPGIHVQATKVSSGKTDNQVNKPAFALPQTQHLLQPPTPQVLVIERMHSGARRFVVLDFGKPVLLTDVLIPACADLASLSIDVWVHGEEVDGQRLVVTTDIGIRSLIMNDLSPPPVCRYLKITTIGRYGSSTTRSRIPIGCFYGHSTILPWECDVSLFATGGPEPSLCMAMDQSQILSQLSMFVALQEDIQCRYSLACNRLASLLAAIDLSQNNSGHTRHYLRRTKRSEEDGRIHQAYHDCTQLQLQLNLAQRAIERLQRALGVRPAPVMANQNSGVLLKHSSTDKLRVLAELLLDTLLGMTVSSPTIPQLPVALYTTFTPNTCEALFHHLCIMGTRRMQIHAGVLLVRICGGQAWWGEFLGKVLLEYFSTEQPEIFPQDRVFILLTALGQKSLCGPSACEVLESILTLLAKLLAPLRSSYHGHGYYQTGANQLDLSLIGWLLLFLSRSLDSTNASSDDDKGNHPSGHNNSSNGGSNRWDFIQGETAMASSRVNSRSASSRLYRRKLQKRLMHHKQQLLDLQQYKKNWLSTQMEKASGLLSKDAETFIKTQEQLFKKQIKQYSSKHFKDIMQIRRTDGELLKKLPKDAPSSGGAERENGENDNETSLVVSREKCVPVVRGLMALLLSMDFTCNVDLFLVTCKVVARLTSVTRPSVKLSEVMSQEELEQLILLCCNSEYNHGNVTWGGAWAPHAINCLLQDILDGEKFTSNIMTEGVTDDEMSTGSAAAGLSSLSTTGISAMNDLSTTSANGASAMNDLSTTGMSTMNDLSTTGMSTDMSTIADASIASINETDNALGNSLTLPSMEEEQPSVVTPVPETPSGKDGHQKFDKVWEDMLQEVDLLEFDDETNAKLQEYITGEPAIKPPVSNDLHYQAIQQTQTGGGLPTFGEFAANNWVTPPSIFDPDDKKQKFESWKNKLATYMVNKASVTPQGVSTALDARLENGIELSAELRLKVLLAMEAESVHSALTSSLPTPVPGLNHTFTSSQPPSTDDELTEASYLNNLSPQQGVSSWSMLSTCFNHLFTQLQFQRVNLDTLLLTWLTLNEETSQDENSQTTFDPSRVPAIPLDPPAVSSLLAALAWTPSIPVRTWVLAFQCLSLLTNLRSQQTPAAGNPGGGTDNWLATAMVADSNMMTVMIKFLSGTCMNGPVNPTQQSSLVGPTATGAFHEFLVRLQLHCAEDHVNHLKELLLKLVYTLAADRGAFHHGLGPLDAQCRLLEDMLEMTFDHVDISNAISVIQSLAALVHQHIMSQEKVVCRSSSENSISARSCFGGLFASMLRAGDPKSSSRDASRDVLMCNLLKLMNILVQMPLPGRSNPRQRATSANVAATNDQAMEVGENSFMTDSSKILHLANSTPVVPNPNVPKSDEEKGSETDEQKTETAAAANANSNQPPAPKSCSHFKDVRHPEAERKEACLADVVLGHPQIMQHLIQTLSTCNSNTVAMILGSSGLQGNMQDSISSFDLLSVGDGVFQILSTLNKQASDINLILRPILDYLSYGVQASSASIISRLSEPLLWFILRVLDCELSIRNFLAMGGVEVVCRNLVNSNQRLINMSPSLVSTIMQYLGNTKGQGMTLRRVSSDAENSDGLTNFAPLGNISSNSPTAGPADVLIQSSPPHRRARSAAWSYHFYPDEAWVDLTITLPCAVLLKEVQIQPHLTSLSTCPSAVTVEVSRDGATMIPICAPMQTSGLTFIKLQLLKAEVATAVTIRLHKPRDSLAIGLSQILLMGYTAFGDSASVRSANIFSPTEDYVSRTSIGWLRLLHHCLAQCEAVAGAVAASAAPTPHLLVTCCALLGSSSACLYATNIEAVLLRIGLHSPEMGLALIDHLLRNTVAPTDDAAGLPLHGKISGAANESTIDILYQLGISQDLGTPARMKALLDWLGDSARVALQRNHGSDYPQTSYQHSRSSPGDLPSPASAHVHCIAAILWQSHELPVTYDLRSIITKDLLSSLYEWSMVLPCDSALKRAVDCVLCSLCYVVPQFFPCIMEWMGIATSLDMTSSITDDHKDSQQMHHQRQSRVSMTDDSKAHDNNQHMDRASPPLTLQEFGHMILDEVHLRTLATACQSPCALRMLLDSSFPAILGQGLYEFCSREIMRSSDSVGSHDFFTDTGKNSGASSLGSQSPNTRTRTNSESSQPDKGLCITADLVAPVLEFLAEIAQEYMVKDWLGSPEGSIFWPTLLNLLCNTPSQASTAQPLPIFKHKVMSSQQRSAMETATVKFFSQVIACHPENQHLFANVLCDVIRSQGTSQQGTGMALSGFTRRLFLQVLLEDEKVIVSLRSESQLYKGPSSSLATSSAPAYHPRCGAGHKYRSLVASLQSSCKEILAKVSGMWPGIPQAGIVPEVLAEEVIPGFDGAPCKVQVYQGTGNKVVGVIKAPKLVKKLKNKIIQAADTPSLTAQIMEDKEEKAEEGKKDTSELGIEVVDQISQAAGLQAKEKREKNIKSTSPPRPPSRRGHRPAEGNQPSVVQLPTLFLFHSLLPGQPLPAELTLSQLLVLLHGRGFSPGQACVDFAMKLRTKKGDKWVKDQDDPEPEVECIPAEVLLDTPSFPSALQVFASVGGLALLAEHLPLLYPEVTRQVSPPDTNREVANPTGIGHDWVTVESSEDIYEDIYEPMPPTQPAQSSRQSPPALPSIPPHSLVAFGLFLRLPGYAEVLLKERKRAQCLLRLVLGVTDDGEGGHILTSPLAGSLPTLPFNVLKSLFDSTPLTTDDGLLLRRMTLEIGAVHLILACLSVLSHHAPRIPIPGFHQEIIMAATQAAAALASNNGTPASSSGSSKVADDKGQSYWAKGTGFGTGSTTSSWDAEQALLRQKSEEQHVTCLLQVLGSYINPGGIVPKNFHDHDYEDDHLGEKSALPAVLPELLSQSCLVPAISSYLRNDSVLDMARHVPLYRSLLELLRGLAVCTVLVPLLLPLDREEDATSSVSSLLDKMKTCVDTYASRLKNNKNNTVKGTRSRQEEDESEGLALLIPDIQDTARTVHLASSRGRERSADLNPGPDSSPSPPGAFRVDHSVDEKYIAIMQHLQFDTFEMVTEVESALKFNGPHHYESNVKAAGEVNNAARARRLAQEAVTLSTSLPLSASSSVFVRCDEDRLDIMKVLITGPSDTPYADGCYEFDVYFPQDYPNSPPLINLETTGNHTVRFNPNLYNDGKVCLSVLNTWHGRPEEKWNPQTSSFLQVLVSIQSLILVSEPYFNEPGYERSRGTPSGTASSREYDANIRQASVKWAMLEMLRNPPACFKEVIEKHFWLKRHEIMGMIEDWIAELEGCSTDKGRTGRTISHSCVALKRHYHQLKEELARLRCPEGLEDTDDHIPIQVDLHTANSQTPPLPPTPMDVPLDTMDNVAQADSLNAVIFTKLASSEELSNGPLSGLEHTSDVMKPLVDNGPKQDNGPKFDKTESALAHAAAHKVDSTVSVPPYNASLDLGPGLLLEDEQGGLNSLVPIPNNIGHLDSGSDHSDMEQYQPPVNC